MNNTPDRFRSSPWARWASASASGMLINATLLLRTRANLSKRLSGLVDVQGDVRTQVDTRQRHPHALLKLRWAAQQVSGALSAMNEHPAPAPRLLRWCRRGS